MKIVRDMGIEEMLEKHITKTDGELYKLKSYLKLKKEKVEDVVRQV